jgi:hypothetical protein
VEMASLVRDSSERTGCRKKWATTTLGASYNGCGGEGKGGPDLGSAMRRRRIRGGEAGRATRGGAAGGLTPARARRRRRLVDEQRTRAGVGVHGLLWRS